MAARTKKQKQELPKPDPALQRLSRLVGKWRMTGRSAGSTKDDIFATTTFKWLHEGGRTGFFLQQDMVMEYAGTRIVSHEFIGHSKRAKGFSSLVFSNMGAEPWPYRWDIRSKRITISIKHGPMNAKYVGRFSADGNSFSGGWRPRPGANKTINAPYDITASRIA
jgi:hypothetical protein